MILDSVGRELADVVQVEEEEGGMKPAYPSSALAAVIVNHRGSIVEIGAPNNARLESVQLGRKIGTRRSWLFRVTGRGVEGETGQS